MTFQRKVRYWAIAFFSVVALYQVTQVFRVLCWMMEPIGNQWWKIGG